GEPIGIELLTGVQPTLDLIGLRTTMAMRWQPAYLLQGRKSVPVRAWVRFRIRFPG
ncbi:MAG: energy transducer TonB, partial [Rhodothermales bacterium]|nr:energy transducer TonB [Rhodothermales bacterium]